MKLHYKIRVIGKVQGVWYRKTAKKEADKWGITGFVMNMPDGSVYIEAEGKHKALDIFVKWCHQGPEKARVEDVRVTKGEVEEFTEFQEMR